VPKDNVIEFYHPKPKPPQAVPETAEDPGPSAQDILREVLGNSEHLDEIVLLMRDKDGTLGIASNCGGASDVLFFLERVKFQMLSRENAQENPGPGATS
jgi:hypothetical protein